MISVENLTKSFGKYVLFDGISFKLNSRERIGLVGRNGHGKTTLFRLIAGMDQPDSGNILTPRGYRIGYVQQHIDFSKRTVLEEAMTGLVDSEKDHSWKAEKILAGLGFSLTDMQQPPETFSGGFQVRLNLAKALVSEPDLLLLDEPTNYLDITSIRWIERFLLNWPHELMLITHDRSFMDKLVTHTLGIHRRKVRKIAGDTGKYYAQIALDEEVYEKTRLNDEKRRKDIELFISRFRAKARLANMVQSRIKTLSRMTRQEKLDKVKNLEFSFQTQPFSAKNVLTVRNLGFGFNPETPLIQGLDFSIQAGERICVIGKNGKGKTTLLKLLAGSLAPQKGDITFHPSITAGVFEQTNIQSLVDSRTVEEEILYSHPHVDRQLARNICGAMMFGGETALKKIAVLSGGEKSRVMLGKILVTPVNLLLLDEPTNHLDMESCDALLEAIDSFDGTVIMVTHNELFLHALAERLIVFSHNGVSMFDGGYQRFLDKNGWEDEAPETAQLPEEPDRKSSKKIRKLRSEIITRRSKSLKPMETRISAIEKNIEHHEARITDFSNAMMAATQENDGPRIVKLSQEIHHCQQQIESLFGELETLTAAYEEDKKQFDQELADLESV
ncbi:MAG: ABC-F family ATP-binding cassette domain-containing protein [Deltaproteobacteria bacterium]|nr:ABC-F family ATP-binding cassette domain-containing protein [Deltaproteobacteria bacterium]